MDDTQPSAGIGTAVSGTGADETITLDGSVYCAYNASGTDAGIGVYLTASSDALTVNSLVQGATGAVQDTGTDGIINVGAIGFLQGIGSSAYGLEIEGTGTATNDTLTNQGWITGTVGVLVKGGGSDTILNSGNISGGIGIGYNSNAAAENIENSGTIAATGNAIKSINSSAGVDIINSGVITSSASSTNGVIYLDDNSGVSSTIDNKGTIIGAGIEYAIDDASEILYLTNSGTIHGGVRVSGPTSTTLPPATIINSGTIIGGVDLNGNDENIFDTGTITGSVLCSGTDNSIVLSQGGTIDTIQCGPSTSINEIRGTIDDIDMSSSDTVDYRGLFGEQTITGFTVGTGSTHDTLSFAANDWGSFMALSKDMTQVGNDTVIKRDSDNSITVVGVTKASLVAAATADFAFT